MSSLVASPELEELVSSADAATIEAFIESLRELASGAGDKMREHAAKHDREGDIPRWGQTYFAGYLHGVAACIATGTGEDSLQVALRYEELRS